MYYFRLVRQYNTDVLPLDGKILIVIPNSYMNISWKSSSTEPQIEWAEWTKIMAKE